MSLNYGFLFDWDGVVVNSASFHQKSWEILASELNLALPVDHFTKGFGKPNAKIIPEVLGWSQDELKIQEWGERKEELYREIAKEKGIELVPGILPFLHEVKRHGIKTAIGTSTARQNVELAIEQHQISSLFQGSICAEDVNRGKPDPEVFLKCAKLLQLPANSCVVFEDSPHGLQAARKGNMKAVGITTSHSSLTLKGAGAELIVDSPKELSVEKIQKLFE